MFIKNYMESFSNINDKKLKHKRGFVSSVHKTFFHKTFNYCIFLSKHLQNNENILSGINIKRTKQYYPYSWLAEFLLIFLYIKALKGVTLL